MGQNPTDSQVHDMINEIDVDGSGVVEFEEFVKFITRLMKNIDPENEVREAYRRFVWFINLNTSVLKLGGRAPKGGPKCFFFEKCQNMGEIIKIYCLKYMDGNPFFNQIQAPQQFYCI